MEHAKMTPAAIYILRIDPGEDVLASIHTFIQEARLQQAVVLGGYGTFATYHLHWVSHNRLPAENLFRKGEGGIELMSMNGLVVAGQPHIHVTLATPEGAFGGHLEPGCIAYVVCEVFFMEVEDVILSRKSVPVSVKGMGDGAVTRLAFDAPA